jgi:tetratricopeptide (TPR) repeat protein
LHLEEGQITAAQDDFARAAQLSPNLGEVYYYTTYYWLAIGDLDKALATIRHAIELDKCEGGFIEYNVTCSDDYLALADVLEARGDPGVEEAEAQAEIFYRG